jgi:hypothetical protein
VGSAALWAALFVSGRPIGCLESTHPQGSNEKSMDDKTQTPDEVALTFRWTKCLADSPRPETPPVEYLPASGTYLPKADASPSPRPEIDVDWSSMTFSPPDLGPDEIAPGYSVKLSPRQVSRHKPTIILRALRRPSPRRSRGCTPRSRGSRRRTVRSSSRSGDSGDPDEPPPARGRRYELIEAALR